MHSEGNRAAVLGRWAVAVSAIMVMAALIAPATAFGATKAATRIVVTSKVTVDYSVKGVTPSVPSVSVKLQKKSKGKWVSLKGAIKMSFWDASSKTWSALTTKTGTTVSMPLPVRGKYRMAFAGSSSAKPATSYTKRLDMIGETIGTPNVEFTDIDATWVGVKVTYDTDWNTDEFPKYSTDGQLEIGCQVTFRNEAQGYYSGYAYFYQQIWEAGQVQFQYRVRKTDIPDNATLDTDAWISSQDDYIVTTFEKVDSTPFIL